MAGGGERNRNHCGNEEEQEQHQGRCLINRSVVIHGNLSPYYHGDDDFLESSHHQPPSSPINLNPQEGGPLGLSLRKSTSLANLIKTTLTQENQQKIRGEEILCQPSSEKLKASNFPAISLQVGCWNWVSKNEGDLVAKIYYAKKKLVWEFLFGSLKRKMEISWSEISSINAFISKGENGRLEIELNEPPQFGQEIKSQPRKHTQWTTMKDFTGEQALICRRHKVEFLPGVLDKHFQKLLQCDNRLLHLSRQPFPINNSMFFPNTCINFSHNQSVIGFSSVLDPPTGSFVGHSSSNVPTSALDSRVSQEVQKTGVAWEQSEKFQIQETYYIPIGEQESMVMDPPQVELYLNDVQNLVEFSREKNCYRANSTCKLFDHQQQAEGNYYQHTFDHGGNGMNQLGYINNIDDAHNGGSVMNHMGYMADEICSIYQPGIKGGVANQKPNYWLPAQVNTNYQKNVLPLDQNMEQYGTLDRDQNFKP